MNEWPVKGKTKNYVRESISGKGGTTMKAYIKLDSFQDIMRLNDVARSCDYDMFIECGAIRVNPKSVMGIFSIGTKKVVLLTTRNNDRAAFLEKFGSFINEG